MVNLDCAGNPTFGGMQMQSQDYWKLFLDTGAPEMYLMFNNARKMENQHVFDDASPGSAGCKLQ